MSILLSMTLGVSLLFVLPQFGVLTGKEGVDYYAEVHTTALNSYCHTIGMPFTIYGMLLWIPMLTKRSWPKYNHIQDCLYAMYMAHYICIHPRVGFLTALVYSVPLYYAKNDVRTQFGQFDYLMLDLPVEHIKGYDYQRLRVFVKGVCISTIALVFQELVGHWLSGDPASRIEGIPNAIMYAMYYSVSHIC